MKLASTFGIATVSALLTTFSSFAQDPVGDGRDNGPADSVVMEIGHPTLLAPGPSNHVLLPNEVTIAKRGTVTFRPNGLGHGLAIYPVSKDTTREHILAGLCGGGTGPCTGSALSSYTVTDGKGDVIFVVGTAAAGNRVTQQPGEILSLGDGSFLTGTARNAEGVITTQGTRLRLRFDEEGRYLIICTNRPHIINDWMFGFVNVTNSRQE